MSTKLTSNVDVTGNRVMNLRQPVADLDATSHRYVNARGDNLLSNGSGLMLSNYNFSGTTFDAADTHGGAGAFRISTAQTVVMSDEFIPVDPSKGYIFSCWAKSGNANGTSYNAANVQYIGIAVYDADKQSMSYPHRVKFSGSADTTLAAPLNPGATTVLLTSGAGWANGATAVQRHFAWWPYTNAAGYSYANHTYSRNMSYSPNGPTHTLYNTNGTWAQNGISGNTVTLSGPWPGPALPAGTPVQNVSQGGSYLYSALGAAAVPNTWTRYSCQFFGQNTAKLPNNDTAQLPPGAAYVKPVFLINYHGAADNTVRLSDLWFSEHGAASTDPESRTFNIAANFEPALARTDASIFAVDATNAERNVLLPNPATFGPVRWTFRKTDSSSNAVILRPSPAKIDGQDDISLYLKNETRTIVHDGTQWLTVASSVNPTLRLNQTVNWQNLADVKYGTSWEGYVQASPGLYSDYVRAGNSLQTGTMSVIKSATLSLPANANAKADVLWTSPVQGEFRVTLSGPSGNTTGGTLEVVINVSIDGSNVIQYQQMNTVISTGVVADNFAVMPVVRDNTLNRFKFTIARRGAATAVAVGVKVEFLASGIVLHSQHIRQNLAFGSAYTTDATVPAKNFVLAPGAQAGYALYEDELAQSIPNNTPTAIVWSDVFANVFGSWSNGSSRFTTKVAGRYIFSGSVALAANATGMREAFLAVNGTNSGLPGDKSLGNATLPTFLRPMQAPISLAVNDYVELMVRQTSGGPLDLAVGSNEAPMLSAAYAGPL